MRSATDDKHIAKSRPVNGRSSDQSRIEHLLDPVSELLHSEPQKAMARAREAAQIATDALTAATGGAQYLRGIRQSLARSLLTMGQGHNLLSEYDRAEERLHTALEEYEGLQDVEGMMRCLNNLGMACKNKGDYPPAMEHYHKSLALSRGAGNKRGEAAALLNIGNVYFQLGDYARALESYQESLLCNKAVGNRQNEAIQLGNIGSVYSKTGENAKALEYFNSSLNIKEEINDRVGQATAHLNIAGELLSLDKIDAAMEHAELCLQIATELGSKASRIYALQVIASIFAQQSKHDRALHSFREALAEAEAAGLTEGELRCNLSIGRQLLQLQCYDDAIATLQKTLSLAENIKARHEILNIHAALAEAYELHGDTSSALSHFRRYHEIEREVLSEETTKKTIALQTWHASEQSLKEAEIYRLQYVELAKANDLLQTLNYEKNEFMGIAAHDLKNQLSSIILSSGMMKRHGSEMSAAEWRQQISRIEMTAERMRDIILKLLDINKLETGKVDITQQRFDIIGVCDVVIFNFMERAKAKQIGLLPEWRGEVIYAFADSEKVSVIIENLVSNAIKFSHRDTEIHLRVRQQGQRVRVEVQDEGPGIGAADQERLFGKFQRLSAKPTGGEHSTGLGLSIARQLAETMNGRLWCESVEGQGSTFILELSQG